VAVPDLSELPDDLLGVRLVLDVWVLAAVVVVPVLDEGRLIGFVTLGWNEPTALPDRVASFAGVAVGMLGSLVTRERVHAELQELNETLDDRVRARSNQLAEEQDRVQALIDAIPDLMFELDPDGVFVNLHRPAGSEALGELAEYLGRPVTDALGPAMTDVANAALAASASRASCRSSAPGRSAGWSTYECRLVLAAGRILAVIRDVTGQVEQTRRPGPVERLADANARAQQALRSKVSSQ
jgi:PAS domain-containing protein